MSKNTIAGLSIFVFIFLAFVSFVMNKDTNVIKEDEKEIVAKEPAEKSEEAKELKAPEKIESETKEKDSLAETKEKDSLAETKEIDDNYFLNYDNYIINDLRAEYTNNKVKITWTSPPKKKLRNFVLTRTASKPEGQNLAYNVDYSDGYFEDTALIPGMRYYYELRGDLPNGKLRSAVAVVDFPGKIELSTVRPHILVNGKELPYVKEQFVNSFVADQKVMIPIKPVIEILGGNVTWINKGSSSSQKKVLIRYRQLEIQLSAGDFNMLINGKSQKLDFSPVIQDDFLFVASDFIQTYLGYEVMVDSDKVTIIKPVEETLLDSKKTERKFNNNDIDLGAVFTFTLPVNPSDGNKWFYIIESGRSNVRLIGRNEIIDDAGVKRHNFVFEARDEGQTVIRFKYFKPGLGELLAVEERLYTLNIN